MATLALGGAVAIAAEAGKWTALAAFAAAAAATAAGTYLDQKFIFPALGLVPEQQNLQGNRIDDFQLSLASEGAPKNFGSGPKCRVPGTVIWIYRDPATKSPFREIKESNRVGGKSGSRITNYAYFTDIAIGVHTGFPISKIHSIWANGQLIMTQTRQPGLDDINSVFVVTKVTQTRWTFIAGKFVQVTSVQMKITSPSGGPNLGLLLTGQTTNVSGFTNGANNGNFICGSAARTLAGAVANVKGSYVLGAQVSNVSYNGGTLKFTRGSGSWSADGFLVGDYVQSSGFSLGSVNNRKWRVTAVSALELTVASQGVLGNATGGKITLVTKRITRSSGSFVADGYVAGQLVVFNVAGEWKVRAVAASYIEIVEPAGETLAILSSYSVWRITGSVAYLNNPNCVNEDSSATPSISQSVPTWDKRLFEDITFYDGSQVAADPTIAAQEGAANAKVWPNESYFVIEGLAMSEFGNTIPVSWSVLVEVDVADVELSTAFARILQRSGMIPAEYDVTDLDEYKVRGYFYSGPRSGTEALGPLYAAYDVLKQERGAKIFFFRREKAQEIAVAASDLGAGAPGEFGPKPALVSRGSARSLPAEVLVEYISEEKDFQKGEARSPRTLELAGSDVVRTAAIQVVLNSEQAEKLAKRIHWSAISNARTVVVPLPPSYMKVLENDILLVPAYGGTLRILVQRVTDGLNNLILAEGFIEEAQTLSW